MPVHELIDGHYHLTELGKQLAAPLRDALLRIWPLRPELVWDFLCQADFIVCVRDFRWGSIAPVTARWHDCGQRVGVAIDNGLKGLGGGTIVQAVGQRVMPSDILGLQRDQPGHGVVPGEHKDLWGSNGSECMGRQGMAGPGRSTPEILMLPQTRA
jgi:hypothetical protein